MVSTPNTDIERLLSEVVSLTGKNPTPSPASQAAPGTPVKGTPGEAAAGYQAPIKGTWYNSGGFDASGALRPNGRRGHGGVDMRAPAGTPLYPMAPGVVSNVGTDPLGGNVVNVQHDNGVRTYYAHLSTVKVQKGDKVGTDTVLGNVGNTGNASHTVPHCHFQVWKDGQLTDPARFFAIPPYTNLSAEEKKQGPWLSEQAKQEAQAFNMKDHLSQAGKNRVASKADKLLKIAFEYYRIIGRSK
jgi:murein DD-endopeptidase MepM/ murein hydrolase activator NlpD